MLFRLSDIEKSYGGTEILRGVSFQINADEKVGLVGRNGAGKTTVFRIITGEESADSGEIANINNLKIGLLEQHVDFHESRTVHEAALKAFRHLQKIEKEMRLLEEKMTHDHSDDTLEKYSDLQTEFERQDGFTYRARAEAVLTGIGFPPEMWEMQTQQLSGGQKNRLGMVRLLLSDADILLLDEPTNHLDTETVEWLENFLKTIEKAYIVISHDRYFLDETCSRIIEIENGQVYLYKGNYSAFTVERELRREQQLREYENQQAFINKTEQFIRKNLAGQKTKQAKSRRTMLQKIERVDAVRADKSSGNFNLKKVERAGINVLAVEDLSIGYETKTLAENITFSLHRGECLGVIGANGTGKTTFLKTVLGKSPELGGKILWGLKTDIGYYSQTLEDLDENNTVLEEIRRVDALSDSGKLRSFLARFLFVGDDVFKRVGTLSGGEKGRLSLAKLIYSNKNVLVLDEPTNHLDIPSREALEAALAEYEGTIITVSHDRFFLDKISTNILALKKNLQAEFFQGNYTQYHDEGLAVGRERLAVHNKPTNNIPQVIEVKEEKPTNNLSKNAVRQIEKRISKIESEIPVEEEKLSKLSFKIASPEIAANHAKLNEITEEIQATETKIQNLYQEWEDLSEQIG